MGKIVPIDYILNNMNFQVLKSLSLFAKETFKYFVVTSFKSQLHFNMSMKNKLKRMCTMKNVKMLYKKEVNSTTN